MSEYEAVPYDSEPFPETHPGRLAAIGRFFGMSPKPIEGARVLELGCAAGNNLIPVAHALPGAEFLGIDTTASAIAAGQRLISRLGLSNIKLEQCDLMNLGPEQGQFDYIIAHGLFSWVAPEIQERTFALCGELLSPQGIAYISYNSFPGWHLRLLMRELLIFSTEGITTTKDKIDRARAVAKLMEQGLSRRSAAFPRAVADQLKLPGDIWNDYGQRAETRREHLLELQSAYGFQSFTTLGHYRTAVHSLDDLAWQTDKGIVLARELADGLRRRSVLLPAVGVMARMPGGQTKFYLRDEGGALKQVAKFPYPIVSKTRIDAASGEQRWVFDAKGGIDSSPAVSGDTVLFGTLANRVHALDLHTGAERWGFSTDDWVDSSPAIWGRLIVFGSYDGHLYGLEFDTE